MTDYTADWTALPTRESADSRLHQGSARRPSLLLSYKLAPCAVQWFLSGVLDICVLANSASPRARAITQSHISQTWMALSVYSIWAARAVYQRGDVVGDSRRLLCIDLIVNCGSVGARAALFRH